MSNEAEQIAQRKAKLDELVRLGVAPYPTRFDRTVTIAALVGEHGGTTAEALEASRPHARVAGRILSVRSFGKRVLRITTVRSVTTHNLSSAR